MHTRGPVLNHREEENEMLTEPNNIRLVPLLQA